MKGCSRCVAAATMQIVYVSQRGVRCTLNVCAECAAQIEDEPGNVVEKKVKI